MTLRNLFTASAVVTLLFGVGLTFFPQTSYVPYGLRLHEVGIYTARFVGATYLGFATVAWLAKDTGPSQARRAIIVGFLVMNVVSFVISLSGVLFGPANWPSTTIVLLTLLFAAGFAYFLLKESHTT